MTQLKYFFAIAVCLFGMASASAQKTRVLNILHTSDMHSRIEPVSPQAADRNAGMGGMARRATLIEQQRRDCPDLMLFDCGDFSQGTPYYNVFKGEVEISMMNLMGYTAAVIGNHEFDFGMDNMARIFKMANFPILSANYDVTGTVLEGLVKPYITLERNGLKIGVFGLSPKMEGLVQAANCEGVTFLDPIATAQAITDKLRGEERCDVVICLSHLGFTTNNADNVSDERLVAQTHGIDAILGGHSHTFMEHHATYLNNEGHSVPVLHSGKNAVYVGQLILTVEK